MGLGCGGWDHLFGQRRHPRTHIPIKIWCTIALCHCPLPPREIDIWIIPQLWDNGEEGDSFWEKQARERTSRGWILYIQVLRTDRQACLRYPLPTGYHQITRHAGPVLPPYSWAPGQVISLFWLSGSSLINSEIDWLRAIFLKIGSWEHWRC